MIMEGKVCQFKGETYAERVKDWDAEEYMWV